MMRRSTGVSWAAAVVLLVILIGSSPDTALGRRSPAGVQPPPTDAQCLARFSGHCLTPAQVRQYYELVPLLRRGITGRGRTIAVMETFGSPTIRADLRVFDRAFGLPDPQLSIVAPLGPNRPGNQQDLAGGAIETALDVEWAHVIAPGARIVVLVKPGGRDRGCAGGYHSSCNLNSTCWIIIWRM